MQFAPGLLVQGGTDARRADICRRANGLDNMVGSTYSIPLPRQMEAIQRIRTKIFPIDLNERRSRQIDRPLLVTSLL